MDARKLALLEALKIGAQAGCELPLYRRGKATGLFDQRTRMNADVANQAVANGLLEVTRVETAGKTSVEWTRVTPAGLAFLLDSESPTRALDELREALSLNQQALPKWAAEMRGHIDELSQQISAEVAAMRERLEQMAKQLDAAIARLEVAQKEAAPVTVPWAPETLDYLQRRKQVGLGTRCSLADLYVSLKETHADMTIKEFHAGLKQLQFAKAISLLPGSSSDNPGPEYALLDGPSVYYYVARADAAA